MQISLNWLNEYVDIRNIPVQQISEAFTSIGLEVEAITTSSTLSGPVVVGEIIERESHPNADNLSCCQVDTGLKDPLVIVCGAPNARKGIKVAVAMIGAILPGDFKIKPTKIRGEKSEGMLCSARELCLADDHEGILELDATLPVGDSIAKLMGLEDTVLTLSITPNRADCLGYIGIARDLAAKLGLILQTPDLNHLVTSPNVSSKDNVTVKIDAEEDVGRFSALYISDVRTIASPGWLQRRLLSSGMRPINLIVDVTNYVMLERSHPIHAYDERNVAGKLLGVRRAHEGEQLITLDKVARSLSSEDLVICDAKKCIGLAGVMGGLTSEVQEDTRNIIIEVAHFSPTLVRKTSKKAALHSEASHRFERGVDLTQTAIVARRVGQLLYDCAKELKDSGADIPLPQVASDVVDIYPEAPQPTSIALRLSRLRKVTGLSLLSQTQCIEYLTALSFKLLDKTDDRMLFEAPSWRQDVEREIDLIEEIVRLHGYDNIPYTLPMMEIGPNHEDPYVDFIDRAKESMALSGFNETVSFPFISSRDLDALNLPGNHPFRETVILHNPIAEEENLLQTTTIINLIKAASNNSRRGDRGSRLFEVPRCYYATKERPVDGAYPLFAHLNKNGRQISLRAQKDDRPIERYIIGGIIDQPYQEKSWNSSEKKATFFQGKMVLCSWLGSFGISPPEFKPIIASALPWMSPGASAMLESSGEFIGYVGELHPQTALAFDLNFENPPVVFELDLERVFDLFQQKRGYDTSVRRFPPINRDLAFVVDKTTKHDDFARALASFKKHNLNSYSLFDVYEGENLAASTKSMAYTFSFQSVKRTLTDKEVDSEIEMLKAWLRQTVGAELR